MPPLECATRSTFGAPVISRTRAIALATCSACIQLSPCGCANVIAKTRRPAVARRAARPAPPRPLKPSLAPGPRRVDDRAVDEEDRRELVVGAVPALGAVEEEARRGGLRLAVEAGLDVREDAARSPRRTAPCEEERFGPRGARSRSQSLARITLSGVPVKPWVAAAGEGIASVEARRAASAARGKASCRESLIGLLP